MTEALNNPVRVIQVFHETYSTVAIGWWGHNATIVLHPEKAMKFCDQTTALLECSNVPRKYHLKVVLLPQPVHTYIFQGEDAGTDSRYWAVVVRATTLDEADYMFIVERRAKGASTTYSHVTEVFADTGLIYSNVERQQ